jgi:hypothetical protein
MIINAATLGIPFVPGIAHVIKREFDRVVVRCSIVQILSKTGMIKQKSWPHANWIESRAMEESAPTAADRKNPKMQTIPTICRRIDR